MFTAWFFFLSVAVLPGSERPVVSVDKSIAIPGERVRLTVRLPKQSLTDTPLLSEELLENSRWRILAKDHTENDTESVWRFELATYLPGVAPIPALSIAQGARTFSTNRSTVEIRSSRPAGDEGLRPSFEKMEPPWDWWAICRYTLLFLCACFFVGLTILNRKKPAPAASVSLSPEEWLKQEINRLKAEKNDEPLRGYLTAMHTYFEKIENVPPMAWTTQEIFHNRPQSRIVKFKSVLGRCDAFRYQSLKEPEFLLVDFCFQETIRLLQCA